jgi:copper transport protein
LLLLSLGALLLLLLGPARPAQAHASFVRSDPPPNSVLPEHVHQVTIWFSEPLEPAFSEIQVFNTQGQQVDSGNSQVLDDDPMAMSVSLPTLPDGTYTVAWRTVSTVDGHALRGSYLISFGEPLAGVAPAEEASSQAVRSPLDPLARGLVLIGALAIVGGLLFEWLLVRPLLLAPDASPAIRALGRRLLGRMQHLNWLAIVLFAGASVLQLLLQAATVFNVSLGDVEWLYAGSVLRTSDWGRFWLWRVWLFSVVAVYVIVTTVTRRLDDTVEEEDLISHLARGLALLAGLGALLTLSLTSHAAAAAEIRTAAIFSDALHLVAAAVWVGGLLHLALAARPVFHLPAPQRSTLLAQLVPRFSTLAILCVGTLIITGLYSTWAQVGIPAALTTPYGLTLLGKLALFLPMLALGAVNLLWLSPRLEGDADSGSRLRRTVTSEAALGLLVLLVVGLLTGLEPARQVAGRQGLGEERELTHQDTVERTDITLTVEPVLAGSNRFLVELRDPQGRPIDDAQEVLLELTYLEAELGERSVAAQQTEPGRYVAEDVVFSVAGDWQAALLVRRPDAFDARTAFRFDVRAGSGAAPSERTGLILWGLELGFLGLLFLGVSLPLGSWRTRPGLLVGAPGALALAAGLILALGHPLFLQPAEETLRNPIPPTSESVATGEQIYADNCQSCHGASGLGDGPAAAGLDPPPADLVFHVPLHPDDDLYTIIHDGIPETAMPAFGDRLSEEETWHLINYLRTLAD